MLYFNDNSPDCATWLRNLYPEAVVSAADVKVVRDLGSFERVHLFAGIGGWELALQIAHWPPGLRVWTGSCPCQPFSDAGYGKGHEDERDLWPEFARLIGEHRPPVVFGEQVASKLGREWLAGVRADLEELGYAVGAADLCAAGVGAPHVRQRLYWVAHDCSQRQQVALFAKGSGVAAVSLREADELGSGGAASGLALAQEQQHDRGGEARQWRSQSADGCWDDFIVIACGDGFARRIEPSILPLAHGVSQRVVRLRAYGNAIVPPLAAVFIRSYLEALL